MSLCTDLGTYEYDPPQALLEKILLDLKSSYDNVDAILVQGDLIVHGLSVSSSSVPNNWAA